jgi:hypothetical protein
MGGRAGAAADGRDGWTEIRRRIARAECPYRGKELASVADRRYADADQIFCCQLRQHLGVDIVVAERRFILLEPQAAQPGGDINRHRERSPDQSAGYHS